jgi:hypothetical protein
VKVNFVKPIIVSGGIGRELVFSKEVSAVPCCEGSILVNVGEGKQTHSIGSTRLDVSTGIYSIILAGEPLKIDNLGAVDDFLAEPNSKGWELELLPTEKPKAKK